MSKLKLNLEELQVESFETVSSENSKNTVYAQDDQTLPTNNCGPCTLEVTCILTCVDTCAYTCGGTCATQCETCVADPNCQYTWYESCPECFSQWIGCTDDQSCLETCWPENPCQA